MIGLVDKDQVLSQDQKDRQKDSLREVSRYCMNNIDCRRTQVLAFFNEVFDSVNCNGGCDVCLCRDQKTYTVEDVTADAITVLKMIQNFDRDDRVTVPMAADVWRGANNQAARKYSDNKFYGAGELWERQDAERLLQWMATEKAIEDFTFVNKAGWSNSYLRVSWQAQPEAAADSVVGRDCKGDPAGQAQDQDGLPRQVTRQSQRQDHRPFPVEICRRHRTSEDRPNGYRRLRQAYSARRIEPARAQAIPPADRGGRGRF